MVAVVVSVCILVATPGRTTTIATAAAAPAVSTISTSTIVVAA